MSLLTLWNTNRDQLDSKRLDQLIAFAGDGRLVDSGATADELRELLAAAPSDLLLRWKDEALSIRYEGFGFVLQDLVNEVGRRLGFAVQSGRYRGRSGEDGHDGIWRATNGHVLLIETKTSSSHRIELRKLAEARRRFIAADGMPEDQVSTLIVIAEEDTEELEAQVRGSRSAWELRLLGVESLYKLLSIKESLDSEAVERQIQDILIPQEFTRLDQIVDLVFATAEDVQADEEDETGVVASDDEDGGTSRQPAANFHKQILPELERHFGTALVKRYRVLWSSPDESLLISCQVSKSYEEPRGGRRFWFGLKRTTEARLAAHPRAYCVFGLGSPKDVVVLPFAFLAKHLQGFFTSQERDGQMRHWHVKFVETNGSVELLTEGDSRKVNVDQYRLTKTPAVSQVQKL